jgi:hypothetical protein
MHYLLNKRELGQENTRTKCPREPGKLIDEGYEVLDIGYPLGVSSESVFYNMELRAIFNE